MNKIRTILFAASLSENSRSFFNASVMLATQLKARIIILHVMEGLQETYEGIAVAIFGEKKWRRALYEHKQSMSQSLNVDDAEKQIVAAVLGELCSEAENRHQGFKSDSHEIRVSNGNVAEEILKQAQSHYCDLIIMGKSRGYSSGNATSLCINSIVKKADIPVMLIPPPLYL